MQEVYKLLISELFLNYVAHIQNKEITAKQLCSAVKYISFAEKKKKKKKKDARSLVAYLHSKETK
jgi:hypothetical protein